MLQENVTDRDSNVTSLFHRAKIASNISHVLLLPKFFPSMATRIANVQNLSG